MAKLNTGPPRTITLVKPHPKTRVTKAHSIEDLAGYHEEKHILLVETGLDIEYRNKLNEAAEAMPNTTVIYIDPSEGMDKPPTADRGAQAEQLAQQLDKSEFSPKVKSRLPLLAALAQNKGIVGNIAFVILVYLFSYDAVIILTESVGYDGRDAVATALFRIAYASVAMIGLASCAKPFCRMMDNLFPSFQTGDHIREQNRAAGEWAKGIIIGYFVAGGLIFAAAILPGG